MPTQQPQTPRMNLLPLQASKHQHFSQTNWITARLFVNFYTTIHRLFAPLDIKTVLDAGCGEGLLLKVMEPQLQGIQCSAFDINPSEIADAKINIPFAAPQLGSVYQIAFGDRSFDLVFCTEVLEHLEDPEAALREIRRVTARYAILSVPNEPLWCFLNFMRGKYMRHWGNTPEHINHWTPWGFEAFARKHFSRVHRCSSLPWTVLLCEV